MIKHKEFSIKILASQNLRCQYVSCKSKNADWGLHIEDDRGTCQAHIDNLCERHLIYAIIDALEDNWSIIGE